MTLVRFKMFSQVKRNECEYYKKNMNITKMQQIIVATMY